MPGRGMLRRWVSMAVLFLVLVTAWNLATDRWSAGAGSPDGDTETITKVVDGDTFATDQSGTIRIIGVDTPETVKPGEPVQCYGPQASAYAKKTLRKGLTVTLVAEQRNGAPDGRQSAQTDRYGRRLAYVYLTDGTFWNLDLVAKGYAKARYFSPNDDHRREFERAEAKARKAGKGLWGSC